MKFKGETMGIIETLKKGINEKAMVKYHKQSIDMQTANVLLTVHKALNEKNKANFESMAETNLPKLIRFCWERVE